MPVAVADTCGTNEQARHEKEALSGMGHVQLTGNAVVPVGKTLTEHVTSDKRFLFKVEFGTKADRMLDPIWL